MGEAVDESSSQMAPADIHSLVVYLRSIPPIASTDLPAQTAPAASPSPKEGAASADPLGKKIFQEACLSCHSWTRVSALSPYATITGTRAINDPTATNVAQIVISGTTRHEPQGIIAMPSFGTIFSDAEIAAVANYITARFGSEPSKLAEGAVAELRKQTSR